MHIGNKRYHLRWPDSRVSLRQAEHLSADIADANRPERLAHQADAHVLGFLREAFRPHPGQLVPIALADRASNQTRMRGLART